MSKIKDSSKIRDFRVCSEIFNFRHLSSDMRELAQAMLSLAHFNGNRRAIYRHARRTKSDN